MMKKILLMLLLPTVLFCCSHDIEYKEVSQHDYILEVPVYLSKTNNLNDDASLQFQNPIRELYVIVIDEPKESFKAVLHNNEKYNDSLSLLDNYSAVLIESYGRLIEDFVQKSVERKKINGMDAIEIVFTGKVNKHNVYYKAAFVEGTENLYQVMSWTLENAKKRYNGIMDHILNSFRLKTTEV